MRPTPIAALPSLLVLVLLAPGIARAEEETAPDLATVEGVRKAMASEQVGLRLDGVKAAKDLQDEVLLQPLVKLLKDRETAIRDAAIDALVLRSEPKQRKSAAKAIATALLEPLGREPSDADRMREARVVPALHDLAQEATIEDLLDDVHPEAPIDLVRARLRAVANVPSKKAIESLIDFGARRRGGGGHRGAVRDALRYATGQTLPGDPDRWRQWWREAKADFDVEAAARDRAAAREAQSDRERKRDERRDREGKGGRRGGETAPDGTGS